MQQLATWASAILYPYDSEWPEMYTSFELSADLRPQKVFWDLDASGAKRYWRFWRCCFSSASVFVLELLTFLWLVAFELQWNCGCVSCIVQPPRPLPGTTDATPPYKIQPPRQPLLPPPSPFAAIADALNLEPLLSQCEDPPGQL